MERRVEAFTNEFGDTGEAAAYEKTVLAAANHRGSQDARAA